MNGSIQCDAPPSPREAAIVRTKGTATEWDLAGAPTAVFCSQYPTQEENSNSRTGDIASPTQEAVASRPSASDYPEPISEYDEPWEWASDVEDYVRVNEDGERLLYTEYQMRGIPGPQPLQGDEFKVVDKPKRFFQLGRIFATDWFEPATADMLDRKTPPGALASGCQGPHGGKHITKSRWFVVVRRRLHHSLCFRITTYGGTNAAKTNRGRAEDFVVLYRANVRPARPYDDEEISRKPIAVIVEAPDQYISPIARLDCGRIYTVEDNLKVAKIGRVHPSHLDLLDEYFKASVK